MKKQNNTAKGARAPNTTKLTKREINRYVRLQAAFEERKAALDAIEAAYPDAIRAMEEYARLCAYLAPQREVRRMALQACNDLACVTCTVPARPFAANALASVAVRGDLPGDAVPCDVAAGLTLLNFTYPPLAELLAEIDNALGPVLPVHGGDFEASLLLMRLALHASVSCAEAA